VKRIVYEIKNLKVLTVLMGVYGKMTKFDSILVYVKPKIFERYLKV
jgi:hypothetical protein